LSLAFGRGVGMVAAGAKPIGLETIVLEKDMMGLIFALFIAFSYLSSRLLVWTLTRKAETPASQGRVATGATGEAPQRSIMAIVLTVLLVIIGGMAAWFTLNNHFATPAVELSQSDFLNKIQSNEIAQATIKIDQQRMPLSTITGTYFKSDANGRLTKDEVPFVVHNAYLAPTMLNGLLATGKVKVETSNGMATNLAWSLVPFLILGVGIWLILGIIIYLVWRTVKKPLAAEQSALASPVKRMFRGLPFVLLLILLGLLGFIGFVTLRHGSTGDPSLANQPFKLRTLPNETVIQAGLSEPQLPWAWQELQNRAQDGRLSTGEANQIMDKVTASMRRDHPQGYNEPLFWLGTMLDEFHGLHLTGETNELAFLDAHIGNLTIEPLPRMRENETTLEVTCQLSSPWGNEHSFGLTLLNAIRSVRIDAQPVSPQSMFGKNWNQQQYSGELKGLHLAPGKHVVRCEVESALIPTDDLAGLATDAPPKDWPSAKRRWTRTCEAELLVYPKDATMVSLSEDPALNPVTGGALAVKQVIIRPKGNGLVAVIAFKQDPRPGLPISVDVGLRLAGQTFSCGNIWAETHGNSISAGNSTLSVDMGMLDPQIKEADIVFTPNPQAVDSQTGIDRIWGKKIVMSGMALLRQDLSVATPAKTGAADYPGDWIWEQNSETLDHVPPIFFLRPSTRPANWVPFDMFGKDRYMAQGQTVAELIKTAWSQMDSSLRIKFEADLPAGKFDFIVAGQPDWPEALEAEINRRFGLTQQIDYDRSGKFVAVRKAGVDGNSGQPAQSDLPVSHPLPIKTIMLAGATNQLVGASNDVRTVTVWTDSTLSPDEMVLARQTLADGRNLNSMTDLFVVESQGKVGTSCGFSWFFSNAFGKAEADAAVAQIQETKSERPLVLTVGKPLELFSVTNRYGGIFKGYLEFTNPVPGPMAAGAKAQATARLRPYAGSLAFYTAIVPPGYRLQGTDNSADFGEGRAYTGITGYGSTDCHTSWSPPRSFNYGQTEAIAIQLQHLAAQGSVPVVFGKPLQAFAITNTAGEIYKGFFELVGPDKQ